MKQQQQERWFGLCSYGAAVWALAALAAVTVVQSGVLVFVFILDPGLPRLWQQPAAPRPIATLATSNIEYDLVITAGPR
jgi:hypothetical protein